MGPVGIVVLDDLRRDLRWREFLRRLRGTERLPLAIAEPGAPDLLAAGDVKRTFRDSGLLELIESVVFDSQRRWLGEIETAVLLFAVHKDAQRDDAAGDRLARGADPL